MAKQKRPTIETAIQVPVLEKTEVAVILLSLGIGLGVIGMAFSVVPDLTAVTCSSVSSTNSSRSLSESQVQTLNQQVLEARADYETAGAGKIFKRGALQHAAQARKQALRDLMSSDPVAAQKLVFGSAQERKLAAVSRGCVEQAAKVQGQIHALHGDLVDDKQPGMNELLLRTRNQTYTVYGVEGSKTVITPGATFQVDGYTLDDAFLVKTETSPSSAPTITSVISSPQTLAASHAKVLTLMGDFNNTDVRSPNFSTLQTISNTVNSYYADNSYGQYQWQFTNRDWYEVPVARGNTCPYMQFAQQLVTQADPDVDFSQLANQTLAILVPYKAYPDETTDQSCAWDGLAWPWQINYTTNEGTIPMYTIWVKLPKTSQRIQYIWNHELGHTLVGGGHASWTSCPAGTTFYDSTCQNVEYGNPYDVMGGQIYDPFYEIYDQGHFSAERKDLAGWIPGQSITINNHAPGQTVTLTPVDQAGAGTKLLRIQRDQNEYTTVEYRQPYQADGVTLNTDGQMFSASDPRLSAVFGGALILDTNGIYTYLLDASPQPTNTQVDSVLKPGQSLTDPKNGSTITVNSTTPTSLSVTVTSPNFDTIPPLAPAIVNDGPGQDIDVQTDTTSLAGNWDAVTDDGTGVAKYKYEVDTPDGINLIPLTDNGLQTSFSQTGLTMTPGTTYLIGVQAIDIAGNASYMTWSDGVTIDTTPPAPAGPLTTGSRPLPPDCVLDGVVGGAENSATNSPSVLTAFWCDSPDLATLDHYQYAIGTTAGATNVVGYTDVGKNIYASRTGLALVEGQHYYFSVRSVGLNGVAGPRATSSGVLVDDTSPPATGFVNDGTGADIDVQNSLTNLSANWQVVNDASGVTYQYAIGTTPGGTDVQSFQALIDTRVSLNNLTLTSGRHYYVSVRTVDAAGNIGPTQSSDGVLVDPNGDTEPPTISITTPTNGSTVGGTVAVGLTAADNSLVTGVQVYVDGQPLGSTLTASPYVQYWDTTPFSNGTHTLTASATDGTNTTTSSAISVTVNNVGNIDTDPPIATIYSPTDRTQVSGIVSFRISVFDFGTSGVKDTQFFLNGEPISQKILGSGQLVYSWDSNSVPNGTYDLTALARDNAGNSAFSPTVVMIVNNPVISPDTTPPAPVNDLRVVWLDWSVGVDDVEHARQIFG